MWVRLPRAARCIRGLMEGHLTSNEALCRFESYRMRYRYDMFFLKSILGVMFVGSIGAVLSKHINLGNLPWWMGIVPSGLGGLVWGWMLSQRRSVIMSSTLYDVTMTVTYVTILSFMGESISFVKLAGVAMAVFGIILVNQ